jgi:uncharacterized repeat protein (TIGR03803 family)
LKFTVGQMKQQRPASIFIATILILAAGSEVSIARPDAFVLHTFSSINNGTNSDGGNPAAGLVLARGVLCGTTLNGGVQGAGTAFYVSLGGTNFNAFHSFTNAPDAGNPQGALVGSGANLFGTTIAGGNSGVGTLFLAQTNGSISIVRSFSAVSADNATNSRGASPSASLALSGDTLFGITAAGGAAANGTAYSLTTNGSTFAVVHDFSALDSNTGTNADGALPSGGLILAGGTLFGTTSAGGAGGAGVVFALNTNGSGFNALHSFAPLDPLAATNADGAFPFAGLVLSSGRLYGTTIAGGANGKGVIFSVGTNGLGFAVLHHFSATDSLTGTNSDGASPCTALASLGGYLYGTTAAGGAGADGTVFSLSTNGSQFLTLYAFSAVDQASGTNRDGALPVAGLWPLGNSLYGTAFSGGPGAAGTVFCVTLSSPPAVITNIVHSSNGSVTVSFLGAPNSTNVVQTTASLTPPVSWHDASTNVADAGGAWQFTETNSTNPTRFYRSYAP